MWRKYDRKCIAAIHGTTTCTYSPLFTPLSAHVGGDGVNQQPHLLKMRRDDAGATVRGKEFHTELLLHRNEELRKVRI